MYVVNIKGKQYEMSKALAEALYVPIPTLVSPPSTQKSNPPETSEKGITGQTQGDSKPDQPDSAEREGKDQNPTGASL